jgi:uncharacterized protein (DUF1330 family)
MRGYITVDVSITDMEGFMEYASRIPVLMEKYGGRYIVKGAEPEVIRQGGESPQFVVIIEFPSVGAADGFIEERSKSELIEIFNRSTVGRILKVEGCI